LNLAGFSVNIKDMNKEIINTKKIKRFSLFLLSFMSMSSLNAASDNDYGKIQKQEVEFSNKVSSNTLYREIQNSLKWGKNLKY